MNEFKPFARFKGTDEFILVESGIEGAQGLASRLVQTQMKLHEEAIHKALAEAGYALVPLDPDESKQDHLYETFSIHGWKAMVGVAQEGME